MSDCKTYCYPGAGEWARKEMSYSQAIRVENRIVCSGQGGWDRQTLEFRQTLDEEVDQAFENVDENLKHAGGKGWPQVYRVVTYSTNIKATHQRIVDNFRKWMPDHQPVWTEIGVKELGMPTMHIEIEVEAFDPQGAAEATKN
ncbi:YjgF-like protein [Durotheca rogersii]|uniref:YjgF-like protein n=1 Tax=Durotheca rogersii TaxID=419775 RepID=UPI002220F466|nr:YjgF-like protein [Durotheca rogersii]KAI5867874.1 YjgF-like protein [Durotheca rogersii]